MFNIFRTRPSYGSNETVIYCVHGKPSKLCCDEEKGIHISKIENESELNYYLYIEMFRVQTIPEKYE